MQITISIIVITLFVFILFLLIKINDNLSQLTYQMSFLKQTYWQQILNKIDADDKANNRMEGLNGIDFILKNILKNTENISENNELILRKINNLSLSREVEKVLEEISEIREKIDEIRNDESNDDF
jgi:predicted PurR-regulated permease PerM